MRRFQWLLLINGVLLVAVAIGAIWFLQYTSTPGFCSSCHPIEPFAESWEGSSHEMADVTCTDCHFDPGAFGYIKGKVYSAMKLVEWAAGMTDLEPQAQNTVVAGSCRQCHESPAATFMPHSFHTEVGNLQCTECHSAVVHGEELVGEDRPHAQPAAAFCNKCHTGDIAPILFGEIEEAGREHPGAPKIDVNVWRNIHWRVADAPAVIDGTPYDQIERETCLACHDEPAQARECRDCHSARTPEFRISTAAQQASGLPLAILVVMFAMLFLTVFLSLSDKARIFGSRWMMLLVGLIAASDLFVLYLIVRDTLIKEVGSVEVGPTTVWITYLLVSAAVILLVLYEGVVKPGGLRLLLLPRTPEDEIYVPDPKKRTIGPKIDLTEGGYARISDHPESEGPTVGSERPAPVDEPPEEQQP